MQDDYILNFTGEEVDEILIYSESTSNKVTSLSSSSTDTQYPSAKCVYDNLVLKAALANPTFTGTPTAPTAVAGTNTTQIATTAFVKTAIDNAIGVIENGAY